MSRPVHFEIQASNPQALMDFYSALLGWTFNKWEAGDYWMITTGSADQPGINGGLMPRRGGPPAEMAALNSYVNTMGVDDVEASLAKAVDLGGTIAVPKMAIPGIGWLGYVKDPDGNLFGMMQPDTDAA